MDVTSAVSTVLGALIGVGSTLVGDRLRFKRDQRGGLKDVRREVYARYLQALAQTDSEIQELRSRSSARAEPEEARDVWRRSGVLALRYEVGLISPPEVADASDRAYRALRQLRNLSAQTRPPTGGAAALDESGEGADWDDRYRIYRQELIDLRSVMRRDIQRVG